MLRWGQWWCTVILYTHTPTGWRNCLSLAHKSTDTALPVLEQKHHKSWILQAEPHWAADQHVQRSPGNVPFPQHRPAAAEREPPTRHAILSPCLLTAFPTLDLVPLVRPPCPSWRSESLRSPAGYQGPACFLTQATSGPQFHLWEGRSHVTP